MNEVDRSVSEDSSALNEEVDPCFVTPPESDETARRIARSRMETKYRLDTSRINQAEARQMVEVDRSGHKSTLKRVGIE